MLYVDVRNIAFYIFFYNSFFCTKYHCINKSFRTKLSVSYGFQTFKRIKLLLPLLLINKRRRAAQDLFHQLQESCIHSFKKSFFFFHKFKNKLYFFLYFEYCNHGNIFFSIFFLTLYPKKQK